MSNWDTHQVTIVGPSEEIQRFAKDFKIVIGKLDEHREIIRDYGGAPSISLDARRYCERYCWVGLADIEFLFDAVGYDREEFYQELCAKYPKLHIIWRYWLDMDWGCGYIDKNGDHRFYEDCSKPHEPEYQIRNTSSLYGFARLIDGLITPELQQRALHQSPHQLFSAYMAADGRVYFDPEKSKSEPLVVLTHLQGWEPDGGDEDVAERIIAEQRLTLSLEDFRDTYNKCMTTLGGEQITAEEVIEWEATNREKLGYPDPACWKGLEDL